METEFRELKNLIREQDKPELERLRREVNGYWDALDPLFEWTALEKALESRSFLRRQVLPRRRAALAIADEISRLTDANLDQQRRETVEVAVERADQRVTAVGVAGVAGGHLVDAARVDEGILIPAGHQRLPGAGQIRPRGDPEPAGGCRVAGVSQCDQSGECEPAAR